MELVGRHRAARVIDQLRLFQEAGLYTDCTVSDSGDGKYRAHRVVLANASEAFYAKLDHGKSDVQTGLSTSVLAALVSFIYGGPVKVSLDTIAQILHAAQLFMVVPLWDAAHAHFCRIADPAIAVKLVAYLGVLGLGDVAEAICGPVAIGLDHDPAAFSLLSPRALVAALRSPPWSKRSSVARLSLIERVLHAPPGSRESELLAEGIDLGSYQVVAGFDLFWAPPARVRPLLTAMLRARRRLLQLPCTGRLQAFVRLRDVAAGEVHPLPLLAAFGREFFEGQKLDVLHLESSRPLGSHFTPQALFEKGRHFASGDSAQGDPFISVQVADVFALERLTLNSDIPRHGSPGLRYEPPQAVRLRVGGWSTVLTVAGGRCDAVIADQPKGREFRIEMVGESPRGGRILRAAELDLWGRFV